MRFVSIMSGVLILVLSTIQCTSTRWTIRDMDAVEPGSESVLVSRHYEVVMNSDVDPSKPFLTLTLNRIDKLEYPQRILAERTLQYYKPRWGFSAITAAGAGFAFYAASRGGFSGSPSSQHALALNSAGALLTLLAVTNMEADGEPIQTGETRYLRQSGVEVRTDTVRVSEGEASTYEFELDIHYSGELLSTNTFRSNSEREWAIRLPDLLRDRTIRGTNPGAIDITLRQSGGEIHRQVEIPSFLRPLVVVTSPVAELRTRPEFDDRRPFTMLGNGSELQLLEKWSDQWFEVQFGGSRLYLSSESGEIQWKGLEMVSQPSVIPVGDVPFGEISVEFSIPVLKPENSGDSALLISNHRMNRVGVRRHLERDLRLMEAYFSDALQVPDSLLYRMYPVQESAIQLPPLNQLEDTSTLFVYLTGFASIEDNGDDQTITFIRMDDSGAVYRQDVRQLIKQVGEAGAGRIVVFADLEFHHLLIGESGARSGLAAYRSLAEELRSSNERYALVFASRPDQRSGIYESLRFEMKYHHIFPYYLAQGLQQRRTRLSNLLQYVESQVDYTSRRLHDRPQSVLSFGDLTIDLAD